MGFAVNPTTDEQIALLNRHLEIGRNAQKAIQNTASGEVYSQAFLNRDRPRIAQVAKKLNELGLK